MKQLWLLLIGLALSASQASAQERLSGWELTPPVPGAKRVVAEYRLAGIYPAGSRLEDDKAPGGHAGCDNWPNSLAGKTWGAKEAISVVAFTNEAFAYGKSRGIALRLINRTAKAAAFTACDSRLFIVQEALDENGRWREIEEAPCPICYRSYHRVFLDRDEYWQFAAREYDGPIKTKLRFRLDSSGVADTAKPIYSNEFDGRVAKVQYRMGPNSAEVRRAFRSSDAKEEGVIATLAEVLGNPELAVPRTGINPRNAALHLAGFGPAARDALPAIRAALKSERAYLCATAAYALWRVDGKADEPVKELVRVLEAPNKDRSRWEAALWLSEMGPVAKDAVPALCKSLQDGDEEVRRKSGEAIGSIRARADIAVPALAKALKDADWYTRSNAARGLGQFGMDAKVAIPQLTESLKDEDGHVKVAAAFAVWRIEGNPEPAVSTLIETLRTDAGFYAPHSAAEKLGEIGPSAKAAVPELTAALKKDDRGLRISAAGALWKITRRAEPTVSVLVRAVEDATSFDESDTGTALGYLERMGPDAKKAVPALLKAQARAKESWERIENVLRKIDPEAVKKRGTP